MVRGWGLEAGAHVDWLLIWVLILGVCLWKRRRPSVWMGDIKRILVHLHAVSCILEYGVPFATPCDRTSACVHHASRRATMKVVS
jgi:uncharacterized iron-regulated membrane protein